MLRYKCSRSALSFELFDMIETRQVASKGHALIDLHVAEPLYEKAGLRHWLGMEAFSPASLIQLPIKVDGHTEQMNNIIRLFQGGDDFFKA